MSAVNLNETPSESIATVMHPETDGITVELEFYDETMLLLTASSTRRDDRWRFGSVRFYFSRDETPKYEFLGGAGTVGRADRG